MTGAPDFLSCLSGFRAGSGCVVRELSLPLLEHVFCSWGRYLPDAEQIFGPSLIYACAVGMVALVAQHMGQGNLFVLGHSLGGGLTQFAVAANRSNHIEGWGFNSAGLSETSVRALLTAADVDQVAMENVVLTSLCYREADPVSKLGGLVGTVTTIPGSADLGAYA